MAWEQDKRPYTGADVNSERGDVVASLQGEVENERRNLEESLRGRVDQGPAPDQHYGHLAVYSPGVLSDVTGGFRGRSANERRQAADTLRQEGASAAEADIRIRMLTDKAQLAYRHFQVQQRSDEQASDALALFTAPEWYFKRPKVPFTRADKQKIVNAFLKVSSQCPGMVIVPGSTVWTEDGTLKNGAFAAMNGRLLHETTKQNEGSDVKGYSPSLEELQTLPAEQAQQAVALSYDRQEQFNAAGREDSSSSFFDIGPLTFALEICQDHNRKRALQEWQRRGGFPAGPHVQILVSHSSRLNLAVARPGGIAVHHDSMDFDQFADDGDWGRGKGGLRAVHVRGSNDRYSNEDPNKTEKAKLREHDDLARLFMGIFTLPPLS